jgi:hypothetical protein
VPPVSMSSVSVSMRHRWFTCVRLSNPYMTCLITPFNRNVRHRSVSDCSSLRLFEVCACTPASEGPSSISGTASCPRRTRTRSWHNTTTPFGRSSTGRFEAHPCKPASGGLLPSSVQHHEPTLVFVTHTIACPSSSGASRGRASSARSWSRTAHE